MRTLRSTARGAFTLVEILVAIAILGIIGVAIVKVVLSQARFTEKQMAGRNARTVSRNALNILLTDLRMVQDNGGLIAANRAPIGADGMLYDSITVRVPFVFGLYCTNSVGATLSMLPVDAATTSLATFSGFAVRDTLTGIYTYSDVGTPVAYTSLTRLPPSSTICSTNLLGGPGINQISYTTSSGTTQTGEIIQTNLSASGNAVAGSPVFAYQTVTYRFMPSVAFPGRIGLFRRVKVGNGNASWKLQSDEIIAPFDTTAGFQYYVLNSEQPQATPPADLNQVRGIQLTLSGSSPRVPANSPSVQSGLITSVFFKNRRDEQ